MQRLWVLKVGPSVSATTALMIVVAFVAIELVACLGTVALAQSPSMASTVTARNGVPDGASKNASPNDVALKRAPDGALQCRLADDSANCPRELELEMYLQIARDERDQALNRLESLQIQADQLLAVVNQFVGQLQAGRNEAGTKARGEVAAKLVKALGGDPEKGDVFDWRERALVKKDGTKVPISKPAEKRPEVRQ